MDATALRWVLAVIGIVVIAGVYLFAQYQNRVRRRGAIDTLTQAELEHDLIEDEGLREELSSISTRLEQDDVDPGVDEIKINPALDASIKQSAGKKKRVVHLPRILQLIGDNNLVAHVLKHADDRVLTSAELRDAFRHGGLQVGTDGYARLEETSDGGFMFGDLSETGSFASIEDPQFSSYGIVGFFDLSTCEEPRVCYELMLKKTDELVRMLDLKVYNQDLQLLTLQHVTETRERLQGGAGD